MDSEIVITQSPNLQSLSTPKISMPSELSSPRTFFSNIGWMQIVLILIVLSFMGVNLFSNLAEVSDWFGDTFGPAFKKIFGFFGIVTVRATEKAVNITATGAKTGIDIVAGTVDSGLGVIEGQLQNAKQSAGSGSGASAGAGASAGLGLGSGAGAGSSALNMALADAHPQIPEPDDTMSHTQKNGSNKAGFCYIGEDRGFRSCIKVNEADTCMSGQIFPTSDICVNPNLRE